MLDISGLLLKIGPLLSNQNDLGGALQVFFEYIRSSMGAEIAMVTLLHKEDGKIYTHRSIGLTEEEQEKGVYSLGEGITGRVIASAKPIVVPKIGHEEAFLNRTGCISRSEDYNHAFLCVPIQRGSRALGSISIIRLYETEVLLQEHVEALQVVAYMLAWAVEWYLFENVDKVFGTKRHKVRIQELQKSKPSNIVGVSAAMMEVFALLEKVANTKTTILLLGESGVGKEMMADAIHYHSPNADGPLVKFNCAALPESIIESELFGHEKGSFTGAFQFRKGRFEEAAGGTIFLDEVGELSLAMQAKLLRVLQEKSFERVGGNRTITVNIRIVAATNRDLNKMVSQGTFRQDLYYRLNVFPLMIPPLRERGSDVLILAEHFVKKSSSEVGKEVVSISPPAVNMLMNYSWPGNVRELENVIQRAVIMCEDQVIHGYDLPLQMQSPVFNDAGTCNNLEARVAALEYDMLIEALGNYNGNLTRAAKSLGMTRRTLGLRMKKFNLTYKKFRQRAVSVAMQSS